MFTFIDNYDVQETRRIAVAAVAKKLLKYGDSVEKVSKVIGLSKSKEEVEQLRDAD